ncbi:MAG: exodeoxyribonuclease V subunit gamma [Verrucomicrobiota bacterium]
MVKVLLAELSPNLSRPRPLPVVIPSVPFKEWLQLYLAKNRGVCMGFNFLMPQAFIERALAAGGSGKSELWSKRQLTWRILPHIEEYIGELGVTNPFTRDRFAMAGLIADRFDQYGHFRPEMIEQWAANAPVSGPEAAMHENWQRRLWTQLQEEIQVPHPALELAVLRESEEFLEALRQAFPKLLVLGTGVIDPLLAQMLGLLGKAGCDVRLHIVLPSMEYLGELRSLQLPEPDLDPEALPMHDGHPLLISMGRHAVGSFLLLGHTLDEQYTHWPEPAAEEASPRTLLGRIQADIREIRMPSRSGQCFEESAFRVHSCFGPRREMETLRDELLRAFHEIPDLKPEEVHVVTPSLEAYAPLVAAILEQGATPLPVRLTELPPSESDPLAEGLLALLEMSRRARFEASEVMGLLHLRAVQEALGITDEKRDEDRARDWIKRSGLTQGLGSDDLDGIGSWRFARDRLIAGRWFGTDEEAVYPGNQFVLPVADALSGDAELLEKFLNWHAHLAELLTDWQHKTTPARWSVRLKNACDQLLSSNADARLEIQPLLTFLAELPCEMPVDCGTILDWLQNECAETGSRTFSSGKITFGQFKQLQNIPCRVLAIVGMQEGNFPRQNRLPAWDLLQFTPKAWDRNPRVDDRQLFLDALLTPTERIIITASTQNVRTGKTEPFSSCVDALLRVAHDTGSTALPLIVKHRLQPFASGYFQSGLQSETLPQSFDQQSGSIAIALAAGADPELCPLWKGEDATPQTKLEISLGQLIGFWKDPALAFLRAQGIALHREEENDEDFNRAPLSVDSLQEWLIKQSIFEEVAFGAHRIALSQARVAAERRLPPHVLGINLWQTLRNTSELLGLEVKKRGAREIYIHHERDHFRLSGTLRTDSVQRHLLDYRVGKFRKIKYYIAPWIQAAAAAVAGHSLPTELLDETNVLPGGAPKILRAISQEEAASILEALIKGYVQGQVMPLCYAPATSDRYAKTFNETGSDEMALNAASSEWNNAGYNSSAGEGHAEAARAAWRDRNPFELHAEWRRWATDIAIPLRAWLNA